jgi:hypothetical protein
LARAATSIPAHTAANQRLVINERKIMLIKPIGPNTKEACANNFVLSGVCYFEMTQRRGSFRATQFRFKYRMGCIYNKNNQPIIRKVVSQASQGDLYLIFSADRKRGVWTVSTAHFRTTSFTCATVERQIIFRFVIMHWTFFFL